MFSFSLFSWIESIRSGTRKLWIRCYLVIRTRGNVFPDVGGLVTQ